MHDLLKVVQFLLKTRSEDGKYTFVGIQPLSETRSRACQARVELMMPIIYTSIQGKENNKHVSIPDATRYIERGESYGHSVLH